MLRRVGLAIPVSYGDNYRGFRILGTEARYFEMYNATLREGRFFTRSFEIVAGSNVAKKLGLKVGDTFTSSHGLAATMKKVQPMRRIRNTTMSERFMTTQRMKMGNMNMMINSRLPRYW